VNFAITSNWLFETRALASRQIISPVFASFTGCCIVAGKRMVVSNILWNLRLFGVPGNLHLKQNMIFENWKAQGMINPSYPCSDQA
jgi:hypothetical protein